jgi:hypothetical protein
LTAHYLISSQKHMNTLILCFLCFVAAALAMPVPPTPTTTTTHSSSVSTIIDAISAGWYTILAFCDSHEMIARIGFSFMFFSVIGVFAWFLPKKPRLESAYVEPADFDTLEIPLCSCCEPEIVKSSKKDSETDVLLTKDPETEDQKPKQHVAIDVGQYLPMQRTLSTPKRQLSTKTKSGEAEEVRKSDPFALLYHRDNKPLDSEVVHTAPPTAVEAPQAGDLQSVTFGGTSNANTDTKPKPKHNTEKHQPQSQRQPASNKLHETLSSFSRLSDEKLLSLLVQLEQVIVDSEKDSKSTLKLKAMLAYVSDPKNLKSTTKVALMRQWMTEFLSNKYSKGNG